MSAFGGIADTSMSANDLGCVKTQKFEKSRRDFILAGVCDEMNHPPKRKEETVLPEPFAVQAADGYTIKGFFWYGSGAGRGIRPVVIINPATSVRCRYYFGFADFLFEHGFDVVAYDYRGIGESRPAALRGFEVSWIDWG